MNRCTRVLEIDLIKDSIIKETTGAWFSKSQLSSIGLAKPISQIITTWFEAITFIHIDKRLLR
jgi:hypothetical protein